MQLPKMIDLELSGSCNYRCRMCPHTAPGRESEFLKSLPWATFTKIIDEAADIGVESIRLHGSGEPTLYKRLVDAVAYCSQRGLRTLITTNGARLNSEMNQQLIDVGLTELTVSAIGYDRETYQRWMSEDNFELIRARVQDFVRRGGACNLYHLVLDPNNAAQEVELYRRNWSDYTGATCEIWQMHNWSGNYQQVKFSRTAETQRSCGRMFNPVLEVRAGGLDGHYGAVVACCMILGNDSAAVLGHLDVDSIQSIWTNAKYQQLRDLHLQGRWNEISYCQGCDQLYDRPDSLIYSNRPRQYNQIKFVQ